MQKSYYEHTILYEECCSLYASTLHYRTMNRTRTIYYVVRNAGLGLEDLKTH